MLASSSASASKTEPRKFVDVRCYQHKDREAIKKLIRKDICDGPESALEAVLRKQIRSSFAYLCYTLGGTGLSAVALSFLLKHGVSWMGRLLSRVALRVAGTLASVISLALWLGQRRKCKEEYRKVAQRISESDVADLYELREVGGTKLRPTGPKSFLVVELTEQDRSEVVGCLGLDNLADTIQVPQARANLAVLPRAELAHIKYLTVSPPHRKNEKIFNLLMHHLIDHAQRNDIKGIFLQATPMHGSDSVVAAVTRSQVWGWEETRRTAGAMWGVPTSVVDFWYSIVDAGHEGKKIGSPRRIVPRNTVVRN